MILGIKNLKKSQTKRGSDYYSFSGYDNGKAVDSKIWKICEKLLSGDVIEAEFSEDEYNGVRQYKINSYSKVDSTDEEKGIIFGIKVVDVNSEMKDIEDYCNKTISNKEYLSLLSNTIFSDGDMHDVFKTNTAAKAKHHDYDGGLCHHTYNIFRMCVSFANIYQINKDLIITAALLHDCGKMFTYKKVKDAAYDLTENGHFFEHLFYGAMYVKEKWVALGYDPEAIELKLLMHCILSHHGQRDWGSPVEPVLQEAQLIHIADLADSRIEMMDVAVHEYAGDNNFTDRIFPLGVSVFHVGNYVENRKGEKNG